MLGAPAHVILNNRLPGSQERKCAPLKQRHPVEKTELNPSECMRISLYNFNNEEEDNYRATEAQAQASLLPSFCLS